MNILEKLQERIEALSNEATTLVHKKQEYEREIGQIETRLTQIVGAIAELDGIIKDTNRDSHAEGISFDLDRDTQ